MKLKFHPDFTGDSYSGAIGTVPLDFNRANEPFEVDEQFGATLLRQTLSRKVEREVEANGTTITRKVFEQFPVFVLVEEAAALLASETPVSAKAAKKKNESAEA